MRSCANIHPLHLELETAPDKTGKLSRFQAIVIIGLFELLWRRPWVRVPAGSPLNINELVYQAYAIRIPCFNFVPTLNRFSSTLTVKGSFFRIKSEGNLERV
jgi:hypothetical protein